MFGRLLSVALEAVVLLSAQSHSPIDYRIFPRVRVGPVTLTSTEVSLVQLLGSDAVRQNVEFGEGDSDPGLAIYKDDPARRPEVVSNHAIVPAGASGAIDVFASDATHLIIDGNGYFGQ